jgi:hypothetical protein
LPILRNFAAQASIDHLRIASEATNTMMVLRVLLPPDRLFELQIDISAANHRCLPDARRPELSHRLLRQISIPAARKVFFPLLPFPARVLGKGSLVLWLMFIALNGQTMEGADQRSGIRA